jgi:hypothetical protein
VLEIQANVGGVWIWIRARQFLFGYWISRTKHWDNDALEINFKVLNVKKYDYITVLEVCHQASHDPSFIVLYH